MSQSVEEILNNHWEGYDINAYRSQFESQPEYNPLTNCLTPPDWVGEFDSPNFNSGFVDFVFFGKYGSFQESEVGFLDDKDDFLGMKLLEHIKGEVDTLLPTMSKEFLEKRISNILFYWHSVLTGFTEKELAEFDNLVIRHFEFRADSHLNRLPDFEQAKIKLRCNGNEAVFLFLCLCEDFWGNDHKEQKRIMAKLEDTFMFNNQTAKGPTKLKNFEKTQNKYRNGGLSNIDGVIQSLNQLLQAGKTKFGNDH